MHVVSHAISRFFAFFFTLMVTLAVLIAAYSAVAGQPVDKTWSAVEALVIAAIVLLLLAVGATYAAVVLDAGSVRQHPVKTEAPADHAG